MGKHSKEETNNTRETAKIFNHNKKTKTKKINGFVIFLLTIILCAAIVAGYLAPKLKERIDALGGGKQGILAMILGHDEETLKNLDKLNIVLIGESGVDDYKQSDTLMVCSYDPKIQKASILSIPRDTYVGPDVYNARAIYKINARYKNGEDMETLFSDLKNITGLDLKYYIRVNTEALKKIVDLIGGVEFDVPIDMKYDDPWQNLHINLKKGVQMIDGAKAEQLLRFRHSNNGATYPYETYGGEDIGRMRTQREFIEKTLEQTLRPENIKKINELVEVGFENLITNIDMNEIIDYIPYAVNFDTQNLKKDFLPGNSKLYNGVWIYVYDKNEAKKLIQDMFFSNDTENQDTQTKTTNETK